MIVFGCCKFVPEFGFGSLYVCGVWFARKSLVFYAWGGWLLWVWVWLMDLGVCLRPVLSGVVDFVFGRFPGFGWVLFLVLLYVLSSSVGDLV